MRIYINKKSFYLIIFLIYILKLFLLNSEIIGFHSWRQADTASIAKNFYESGNSILYPQIDWRGDTDGFVESEFHLYPYLVSILYYIFGLNEFLGRLVSMIFSLISSIFLFQLVKNTINENTAFFSAIVFSILPMNFFFSRAFMPESTMIMFSIIGIYYFYKWIVDNKSIYYLISLVSISLAVLIKLPVLYLGIPLTFLSYFKYGFEFLKNLKILLFSIIVIFFSFLWYYHSHNLYLMTGLTFNIWNYGSDKWGTYFLLINPEFYNSVFLKSIVERQLTFAGFIMMLIGLFIKRDKKIEFLFDWWLIAVIFFILFVSQGNLAQEYYQLPIVVPASVFIGKFLNKFLDFSVFKKGFSFKQKFISSCSVLLFVFLILLSALRIENLLSKEIKSKELSELIDTVNNNSNPSDKIISFTQGNPVLFYNVNRKGWLLDISEVEKIDSLKNHNAKLIIGDKKSAGDPALLTNGKYEIILNNNDFFCIKLN